MVENKNKFPLVRYVVEGKVARIQLDREEKKNSLSSKMIHEIILAFSKARKDKNVVLVSLESLCKGIFCSGGDINEMLGGTESKAVPAMRKYVEVLKQISFFPKLTICKLDGNVYGGGVGLMLACDIVIAKRDVVIATPETKIGIFPLIVGAMVLKNINLKKAMKMLFLGEDIKSLEAEKIGLVSEVVPADEFDTRYEEILLSLSRKNPEALLAGKRELVKIFSGNLGSHLESLRDSLIQVLKTRGAIMGMSSFIKKRRTAND